MTVIPYRCHINVLQYMNQRGFPSLDQVRRTAAGGTVLGLEKPRQRRHFQQL
jgi:hypothetical protein